MWSVHLERPAQEFAWTDWPPHSCTDVQERDSAVAWYKLYFYSHYNVKKKKNLISFGESIQSYQPASNESINKNEQHRKELLYSCLAW